jgi:hypothetical protein
MDVICPVLAIILPSLSIVSGAVLPLLGMKAASPAKLREKQISQQWSGAAMARCGSCVDWAHRLSNIKCAASRQGRSIPNHVQILGSIGAPPTEANMDIQLSIASA